VGPFPSKGHADAVGFTICGVVAIATLSLILVEAVEAVVGSESWALFIRMK